MSSETGVYVRKKSVLTDIIDDKGRRDSENHDPVHETQDDDSIWEESNLECMLFFQSTTPCRELDALPWTYDHPMPLTENIVKEVISFYDEKIAEFQGYKAQWKEKLNLLEQRIVKATPELYDKIGEESDECLNIMTEIEKEIEGYKFQKSRFEVVQGMMDFMNLDYELIYYRC